MKHNNERYILQLLLIITVAMRKFKQKSSRLSQPAPFTNEDGQANEQVEDFSEVFKPARKRRRKETEDEKEDENECLTSKSEDEKANPSARSLKRGHLRGYLDPGVFVPGDIFTESYFTDVSHALLTYLSSTGNHWEEAASVSITTISYLGSQIDSQTNGVRFFCG